MASPQMVNPTRTHRRGFVRAAPCDPRDRTIVGNSSILMVSASGRRAQSCGPRKSSHDEWIIRDPATCRRITCRDCGDNVAGIFRSAGDEFSDTLRYNIIDSFHFQESNHADKAPEAAKGCIVLKKLPWNLVRSLSCG
jgi:hypothetical protein